MMMPKKAKSIKKVNHQKELSIEHLLFFYAQRNFWESQDFLSTKSKLDMMCEKKCFAEKFIDDGKLDFDSLTLEIEDIYKFQNSYDLKFLLSDEYRENKNILNSLFEIVQISKNYNYPIFSFFSTTYNIKKHYIHYLNEVFSDEYQFEKISCIVSINQLPPVSILPSTCFFKSENSSSEKITISVFGNDKPLVISIGCQETTQPLFDALMKRTELNAIYTVIDVLCIQCIHLFNDFFDKIDEKNNKISEKYQTISYLDNLYFTYKRTSYFYTHKFIFKKIYSVLSLIKSYYVRIETITQEYKNLNTRVRKSYKERIVGLILSDIKKKYYTLSKDNKEDILIINDMKSYSKQKKSHLKKNAELCIKHIQLFPISDC